MKSHGSSLKNRQASVFFNSFFPSPGRLRFIRNSILFSCLNFLFATFEALPLSPGDGSPASARVIHFPFVFGSISIPEEVEFAN